MEDCEEKDGAGGGQGALMDLGLYSIVGVAAMVVIAGLVGLRLIKDELLLRRKRILSQKY